MKYFKAEQHSGQEITQAVNVTVSAGVHSSSWSKIHLRLFSKLLWYLFLLSKDGGHLCVFVCVCVRVHMYLRVKLLSKDEVGWCASDGYKSTDGRSISDAERQTFADHVIPLGGILGVSPSLDPLHVRYFNGDLKVEQVPDINWS